VGRQHQAALHGTQRRILSEWLRGEHIQPCTSDHTGLNRFRNGGLIDDAAASAVHDARRGLHRAQQLGVHQVFGVRCARDVQGDVVRLPEQILQRRQTHLHLLRTLGGHKGIEGDHIHAHRLGDLGHVGADLAQAHHTENFLVELVADVLLAVPGAGPHRTMGLGHVAREGEQQRQSMFGGGDGVALWGIHHQHTALRGRRHVHVVDTHAGSTDDAQTISRLDHISGDLRSGTNHQGVVLADDRLEFVSGKASALIHLGHLPQDV